MYDVELYLNNCVAKNNGVLDILNVRFCSNTLNALKQVNVKRIREAEISLSTTKETKSKRADKRRNEEHEGPGDP